MVLRQGEIMHHRTVREFDGVGPDDTPVVRNHVVVDRRRAGEVPNRVKLTCVRIDFRMRRHATPKFTLEVARTQGFEFIPQLERQRAPLHQ
ncbi:hypothetical protein D3C73_1264130 [compost metagenome]